MTNSTTASTPKTTRNYNRETMKPSDEAPMVITRLSGWINMGEAKTASPAWIVPTRIHTSAR